MKKFIFILMFVTCPMLTNMLAAQNKIPNKEERTYSLSLIWKELHHSFAFPETLQQVNIDSLYIAYIPKIEQVKSDYEYYRVLCAFMAHFNEAHTRINTSRRPDDTPPLKIINFGEKIIVSNVAKNLINKIPLKSEIIKINNIPVMKYIKDSVYQYISASTPHWKFDKSVSEMFYGKPLSRVNLTIKTPKGKEKEIEMIRNYNFNGAKEDMVDATPLSPIYIKNINGNIGYIQLTSFVGKYVDTIETVFKRYLPELRKCKGLIVDIRGNRGGTDQAWVNIACHLISESQFQEQGKWFSRKSVASYKMWGEYDARFKDYYQETAMEEIKYPPYINKLNDSLKLHQPLIIISGQYVGSASEDFLTLMKERKRAIVVGGPSVGCIGEPIFIKLPGDFEAMICAKKYVNFDGTQPNKTGILPDIEVESDYNAYQKSKDNVLERAILVLRKQMEK